MPRMKIKPDRQVEYLSILASDGRLDKGLEPDLPDDLLLRLHRTMLLARRYDERMLNLQRQGKIGTFAPIKGQEAAQVGTIAAIGDDDWFVPSFRELGAAIWRELPLDAMFLYIGGFNEGGMIPEGTRSLPIAIPVGTQTLHAVGLGYGVKYRRTGEVAMTYFGDGATSQGDFNEALNFAAVYKAPVVFVCQNNQWAISMPRAKQAASKTLAQRALGFDVPAMEVDGNDVLACHVAASEAVERARAGDGPTMIECVTYRMEVHTTADDPTRYRSDEEVAEWRKRDPVTRFQRYLIDKGLLSDGDIEALEGEIKDQVQQAWDEAQRKMEEYAGDHLRMFDHVHGEMPPDLIDQREELKRALAAAEEGRADG